MTAREFLFCDRCNQQGLRTVEHRRHGRAGGRRLDDERAWFEGSDGEAAAAGWQVTGNRKHYCPRCLEKEAAGN